MPRCRNCGLPFVFFCVVSQAAWCIAIEIPAPQILDRKIIELDEPFTTFAMGGGGRYFAFYLKKARQIALLDVSMAEIVKTIDAPGEDLIMTAGLDKLIIANPSKNLIHRYDLATLKRERSIPITGRPPLQMLLGSASSGPLLTWAQRGPISLLDVKTLRPLPIKGEMLSGDPAYGLGLTAAADGRTFCGWTTGISGQQFGVMRLNGGTATLERTPDGFSDNGRWLLPNCDGSLFFQNGGAIYRADLQPVKPDQFRDDALYPTEDPRFFLAISDYQGPKSQETSAQHKRPGKPDRNAQAWICTSGGLEKLISVVDLGHVLAGGIGSEHGNLRLRPRVTYIPSAHVMVSIPAGEKQVILIEANLIKMMQERGGEYLHVVSAPPRTAWVGQPFDYQLETITHGGTVRYAVEAGPDNLKVSDDGKVIWTPRKRPSGGTEKIVIVTRNGEDLESFHSFEVAIERSARPAKPLPRPAALGSPTARSGPKPEESKSPNGEAALQLSDEPTKVDADRLEVPKGQFAVASGLDDRTTLLLQGQRLTILGGDGVTPEKSVEFKKPYVRIGERETYWVGVSNSPIAIEVINKQSLAVTRSLKFAANGVEDLALHPHLPVSYVAFKGGDSVPHFKFISFQEARGEARESDRLIGNCLAVDPGGGFLVAGYRDIYERGASVLFNPDRFHIVPEYGNIDFLIRYDLDRAGMPAVAEVKAKAGGNGRGIRLSRDGKRVTYLSVVGSPPHSGDLTAWDASDFEKVPAIYAIKSKARTDELAYHPFLPWVACLGANDALLLDRESGDELGDKLEKHDFDGTKLSAIWFSADGTALIFDTLINEIHYLHRVKLALTADERKAVDSLYKKRGPLKQISNWVERPAK